MPRLPSPRPFACAFSLACALACGAALCQEPAPPDDPVLVVTRTVQPRVAYRGLDPSANPVEAQARLFPLGQFGEAIGVTLVDDDSLAQHASAGLADGALAPLATGVTLQPLMVATPNDLRVSVGGVQSHVVGLGQFLTRSLLLGTGAARQHP